MNLPILHGCPWELSNNFVCLSRMSQCQNEWQAWAAWVQRPGDHFINEVKHSARINASRKIWSRTTSSLDKLLAVTDFIKLKMLHSPALSSKEWQKTTWSWFMKTRTKLLLATTWASTNWNTRKAPYQQQLWIRKLRKSTQMILASTSRRFKSTRKECCYRRGNSAITQSRRTPPLKEVPTSLTDQPQTKATLEIASLRPTISTALRNRTRKSSSSDLPLHHKESSKHTCIQRRNITPTWLTV